MTTFFIDEKIDTGAMILQEETEIASDETVGSLHDKLMDVGSGLVLKTVALIQEGPVETTIQPRSEELKTAYKLNKDNCKIDWTLPLDDIYNKIRGLNPFPTAWSQLKNGDDDLDVKLYGIEKEETDHDEEVGTIVSSKSELKVAVSGGYINILEMQLPGKRKMDVKSLLNGYHFEKMAKML